MSTAIGLECLFNDPAEKGVEPTGEDGCDAPYRTDPKSAEDRTWDVSPQSHVAPEMPDQ